MIAAAAWRAAKLILSFIEVVSLVDNLFLLRRSDVLMPGLRALCPDPGTRRAIQASLAITEWSIGFEPRCVKGLITLAVR
jgi:hypothetical protein